LKYLVLVLSIFFCSFITSSDSAKKAYEHIIAEPSIPSDENWVEYQTGIASWYGPGFHGRRTANGEIYDMYAMTSAHKKLPFGTKVRVTDLNTGNFVIVRINDRGPFIKGRVIDLSKKAMQDLAGNSGLVKVKLEIVH